jgi:hypothetical protein
MGQRLDMQDPATHERVYKCSYKDPLRMGYFHTYIFRIKDRKLIANSLTQINSWF